MNKLQEEIIKRCQQGDRRAQTQLYQQFAHAMYNTAYRLVRKEDVAADVLQEAFVKAFRNLHTLENAVTFPGWLKRIVINTAINTLRADKQIFVALEEKHGSWTDQEEDVWEISAAEVRDAILELAPGYRAVCSLYLLEGYEHKEIAEILGISVSTSLTQYQRGKKKIRSLLQKQLYHG